ncbi:hypothetical protein C1646_749408 [Rhizophagus diaphanus]|nr:hypothetical protein C1646_749408 [Rhizophagus diaphanus] [Rhizophagus sp. MUCL 43196]
MDDKVSGNIEFEGSSSKEFEGGGSKEFEESSFEKFEKFKESGFKEFSSINQSNAIATPQQQPIVTSGVQTQSQQPTQITASTDIMQDTQSSPLNMSVNEAINFSSGLNYNLTPNFGIEDIIDFDDFVNFDEIGSSSNTEKSKEILWTLLRIIFKTELISNAVIRRERIIRSISNILFASAL